MFKWVIIVLRRKALKKILLTTFTAFIILVISVFNTVDNKSTLQTNLEVEYITGIGTNVIYLLDQNDYLVKTNIFLDSTDTITQIELLLKNLTIRDNNNFQSGLKAIIPENTKVEKITFENKIVTINFSKEFLNIDKRLEKQLISAIVYSIMDLDGIDGVSILVNGKSLLEYPYCKEDIPSVITKEIGINEKSSINSRNNIQKVVIYYVEDISNNNYYVPVTRYLNDDRDKIKIIIDELTTSYIYEPNLMSFLNSNVELLSYEEKENVLFLNFNNVLNSKGDKILEEVKYSIAYSVFDNYNVSSVMFSIDGNLKEQIKSRKFLD